MANVLVAVIWVYNSHLTKKIASYGSLADRLDLHLLALYFHLSGMGHSRGALWEDEIALGRLHHDSHPSSQVLIDAIKTHFPALESIFPFCCLIPRQRLRKGAAACCSPRPKLLSIV